MRSWIKPHLKLVLTIGLSLSKLTNYLSLGYFTWVFFFFGWGSYLFTIYNQIIPNITTNSKSSSCQNYLGGLGSGYK